MSSKELQTIKVSKSRRQSVHDKSSCLFTPSKCGILFTYIPIHMKAIMCTVVCSVVKFGRLYGVSFTCKLMYILIYALFLAFDFCQFCVVIRFFHPTSKDFLFQMLFIAFIFLS